MPQELEKPVAGYFDNLLKAEAQFFKNLTAIYAGIARQSPRNQLKTFRDMDLASLLAADKNYAAGLTSLERGYVESLNALIKEAAARGVTVPASAVNLIREVQVFDLNNVLNSARDFSFQVKDSMLRSIIAGQSTDQAVRAIVDQLGTTPEKGGVLLSHQARVAANDSFRRFNRAATFQVYKADPEVRFLYEPQITLDTTRDSCRELVNDPRNASGEGLTLAELEAEYVGQSWEDGSTITLDGGGGFNCQHDFEVA